MSVCAGTVGLKQITYKCACLITYLCVYVFRCAYANKHFHDSNLDI